ncbi:MAG: isoprenylcysteine carboxylmethyltransferase family protein [Actinobacteria bacterium]|nr:MAG: isoprenylcysteine carboxylmethyltransferase family protein [Actinomycetota bacterium]
MPLLISDDTTARWLLYGTAIGAVVAETIATYLGQARRGERGPRLRGLGESFAATTLGRSRGGESADRGTKRILVWSAAIGLTACLLIAINVPSLRFGANTWTTLVLGLAIAWLGVLLRVWAVWSLGRFFQRDVMIQKDHVVWRGGPYRLLRHPAYAGTLISYLGFGLAVGSWVGALVFVAVVAAGYIPRIRVEEAELTRALGDSYRDYARTTARLVPGLW